MEGFDLAIIGSGPGNVVVPQEAGQRVALIEGATFGVHALLALLPTKMLAYTAELATHVRGGSKFGLRCPERCTIEDGVDLGSEQMRYAIDDQPTITPEANHLH